MESHTAPRSRLTIKNATLLDNEPPNSASRDPPPLIRRDFVTSPWKRFRPSTDDVQRLPPHPRRRSPTLSTKFPGDFHDRPVPDATELSASNEPPARSSRSRRPGFTGNTGATDERRPYPPSSHAASSVDFHGLPVSHVTESRRHFAGGPSCRSKFTTTKADSRLDLASSAGLQFVLCQLMFFPLYIDRTHTKVSFLAADL